MQPLSARIMTRNVQSVTKTHTSIRPEMDRKPYLRELRTVLGIKRQMMIRRRTWSRRLRLNILFVISVQAGLTKVKTTHGSQLALNAEMSILMISVC